MSASGDPEARRADRIRGSEVEVKLPATDLDAIRGKLREAGATIAAARHLERNCLYDDAEGSIKKRGFALRLRRNPTAAILTFKGRAQFAGGVKTREERETRVEDPDELDRILRGLGYEPCFRYEKHREEWSFERCIVALDETAIGKFVEVEGAPTAIRGVLARLGLDPAEALPYSYPDLYSRRRREDPSLPADMLLGEA